MIVAAHQQATRDWWQNAEDRFDLFTSQVVVREASLGNASYANERISILRSMKQLKIGSISKEIANRLIAAKVLPEAALDDALHIGVAVSNGIDYLVTWNFKHLANALVRRKVDAECVAMGFRPTLICTCEELTETTP